MHVVVIFIAIMPVNDTVKVKGKSCSQKEASKRYESNYLIKRKDPK